MNRITMYLCSLLLGLCLIRPAAAQYGQVGTASATARAINDARDVVGNQGQRAAVWTWSGNAVYLPSYTVFEELSNAYAINNFGDVVGSVSNGNQIQACVWQKVGNGYPTVILLGSLFGSVYDSTAYSINDLGWVVGSSQTNVLGNVRTHAFVQIPGQAMLDITPTATEGVATAVNNRGVVVGYYRTGGGSNYTPFRWTPNGGLQDLPYGLISGQAFSINDQGLIAGSVRSGGEFPTDTACVWRPDGTLQTSSRTGKFLTVNQEGMLGGTNHLGTQPLLFHFDTAANQYSAPLPAPAAPYNNVSISQIVALTPHSPFYNFSASEWNGAAIMRTPDWWVRYPYVPNSRVNSRAIGTINLRTTPTNPSVVGGTAVAAEIELRDSFSGAEFFSQGDTVVRLSASLPGCVDIPAQVIIPEGESHVSLTIQTLPSGMGQDVDIVAAASEIASFGEPEDRTVRIRITHPMTTVSGAVTLQGCTNNAQPIVFEFRNTSGQIFARNATTAANGNFSFTDIPRGNYTVWAKGARWLANTVTFDATAGAVSGVTVTLKGGDATGNNVVDIADLLLLINHYNQHSPNTGYLAAADFNNDGANDIADLLILIGNYNQSGSPGSEDF
jgi:probable HAF family extracellular repeat protein